MDPIFSIPYVYDEAKKIFYNIFSILIDIFNDISKYFLISDLISFYSVNDHVISILYANDKPKTIYSTLYFAF